MTRLLVLNPNTTPSITARLLQHARIAAGDAIEVACIGARFGARYIVDEPSAAIAAHAALDAYAAHVAEHGEPSAVLLGCFGDPGLFALRAAASAPVVGLAEASMSACAKRGRFAIVTGGAAWGPMLETLARVLGLDRALAGVQTLSRSGGDLAADPDGAPVALAAACTAAVARWPDVRTVLLGGAGLAGMSGSVADILAESGSAQFEVRDSVALAVETGVALARGAGPPAPQRLAENAFTGVSPELAGFLARE